MIVALEYCDRAGWTSNAALDVQRGTREEEGISAILLTHLAELFQIPHLTNRRAPLHEQPLVQAPTLIELRRPGLERKGVASHTREVVVVKPADRLFASLHTDGDAILLGAGSALSCGGIA